MQHYKAQRFVKLILIHMYFVNAELGAGCFNNCGISGGMVRMSVGIYNMGYGESGFFNFG